MKQIVQSTGKGHLSVIDVPEPVPSSTEILVQTTRSLVSSGTERALRQLSQASMLKKAQARPDLVKQVLNRVRSDGLRATLGAVKDKMEAVTPLGYSAAGIVLEGGEHAPAFKPGTRVATASVGHAEVQAVPGLLTVPIPDNVSDETAAFGAVAAIAMHGLHQAGCLIGDTILIAGLGLVGQLAARLANAAGLRVIGTDLDPSVVKLAERSGISAAVERGSDTTAEIFDIAGDRLPDAVLITASSSSSEPVQRAVERVRDRGRIVVVGDIGLDLDRTPFYLKEVDLRFARSYGPGRYDPNFEQLAVNYPVGYVPRTQRTNIAAFLDLAARGRIDVKDLVTSVYKIEDAAAAYEELGTRRECLAIQFAYDDKSERKATVRLPAESASRGEASVALIGSGDFVRSTLLPAMRTSGWGKLVVAASEGGLSAQTLASRAGIPEATTDIDGVLTRSDIDTVFIATRHDSHAELVTRSLEAGKNVFCEKPLAINEEGFDTVLKALDRSSGVLWMGFNRRYAPGVTQMRQVLMGRAAPLTVHYRISAGPLPDAHWQKDVRQGGRVLGEVCHFVDTASWIIGSKPVAVTAVGRSQTSALLQENVTLLVAYTDGSTASIEYVTDGHRDTPKEQIEVNGRGHTIVLTDFTSITVDGRKSALSKDKGHALNLQAFHETVRTGLGLEENLRVSISTTAVLFAAIASLISGRTEEVAEVGLIRPMLGDT